MALLNPPEIRVSVLSLIAAYLASRRGGRDHYERLVDALAPPSLASAKTDPSALQRDVRRNLRTGLAIGLFEEDGDDVRIVPAASAAIRAGNAAFCAHLRQLVMDPTLNDAPWGRQVGARDLTNSLAWFLMFPAALAPQRMEGVEPSARTLQERDFGPRRDGEADESNWPIGAAARWRTFEGWVCALGFAWRTPNGLLVPDPTPAIRDVLHLVFHSEDVLAAASFIDQVALLVPVLDRGAYREFVRDHQAAPQSDDRLSGPTSDAIERLRVEKSVELEDRADAPRLSLFDGSTFSHVRRVA
jgi:hypothetical protein